MPAQSNSRPSSRASAITRHSGVEFKTVLHADDVSRVLDRIAHQILEKSRGGSDLALLGIPTRGAYLARRLASRIRSFGGVDVGLGMLDITLHRDDLRTQGIRPLGPTEEPEGGIDGKLVILVDDVLFSGRTVRAALDALNDLGRPRAVQLAVLVDRGHRELPIRADYVGKNLPTAREEQVKVSLTEIDDEDAVHLVVRPAAIGRPGVDGTRSAALDDADAAAWPDE
ncbi:bifunctional pyr operon transcriptional regulator/uracil phosphoribosyltransferase PyrR [Jatrophihabitans sp. DSM 45814]